MPFEQSAVPLSKPQQDRSLEAQKSNRKPDLRLVEPEVGDTRNIRVPQKDYFPELVRKSVPILFERAISEGKTDVAFMQLANAYHYQLENFAQMKERFLLLVDNQLAQSAENLVESYRTLLKNLRENVLAEKFEEGFDDTFIGNVLGEPNEEFTNPKILPSPAVEREFSDAQFEVTMRGFENAIMSKDIFWAYHHLASAQKLFIPSFNDMIREFTVLIDETLEKSDAELDQEYRARLIRLKNRAIEQRFD